MAPLGVGDIVKIAVLQPDPESGGDVQHSAQLITFDQKRPLPAIIQELCGAWNLADPEQFALKFSDTKSSGQGGGGTSGSTSGGSNVTKSRNSDQQMEANPWYITEKNRGDIVNGSVLKLTYSAAKTSQDILDVMRLEDEQGNKQAKMQALQRLSRLASDGTFAQEFINIQGLSLLVSHIEAGVYAGEALSHALASFVQLMEHGYVFWDVIEPRFISKVAMYVNNIPAAAQDLPTLKSALTILECLVVNSSARCPLVDQAVPLPSLTRHLQSNADIQQCTVALINALFARADQAKRKAMASTLSTRQIRDLIVTYVIPAGKDENRQIGAEMAHQLYVLQTQLLNMLDERMNTKLDLHDQEAMSRIVELRKIAFDHVDQDSSGFGGGSPAKDSGASTRKIGGYAKDYKRLGFKNTTNPAEDFQDTPPGLLALDTMYYFARHHRDNYTKVVLENSCRSDEHECPFGSASIQLTKLLCEILKVGEPPTEQGETYYRLFFAHDHPFEEFFCVCVMLLNKTWKEMRASREDLVKVFSVVREQVTRALATPGASSTLDVLRSKLSALTYAAITGLWQQEARSREECMCQALPIAELREHITPDVVQLIRQQRINYLVEGTTFTKYSAKGQRIKDKFWHCRLAPNHKIFHYGDCTESLVPSCEHLPNKVSVIDVKALLVGKDCPHLRDSKSKKATTSTMASLTFSIVLHSDSEQGSLDFVAPAQQVCDYWVDGVNALLGQPMTSAETRSDLETLLSLEIKVRLLDMEGVKIPETSPPKPEDPPNYDFPIDCK